MSANTIKNLGSIDGISDIEAANQIAKGTFDFAPGIARDEYILMYRGNPLGKKGGGTFVLRYGDNDEKVYRDEQGKRGTKRARRIGRQRVEAERVR